MQFAIGYIELNDEVSCSCHDAVKGRHLHYCCEVTFFLASMASNKTKTHYSTDEVREAVLDSEF